jgi:hypothetical protein
MSRVGFAGIGGTFCQGYARIQTVTCYLGIHMPPHKFRHLAGHSYLEENPEDFETAKSLLGHGWSKTTQIYVGSESRRASRAYNNFVFEQREARGSSASGSARASPTRNRSMRKLKHLPVVDWPEADREAFRSAYHPGDIFDDDCGRGAHLSQGWRRMIETSYRRWLMFLTEYRPAELLKSPAERITPELVQAFIEHLSAETRATTVAVSIANLYAAARLIAPAADWRWLASLKTRLSARAEPQDRFDRLVPPPYTLDLGIEMMDQAGTLPSAGKRRELHYRDGLIIALVSVWPKRRRSIAALTVTRHLEFDAAGVNILLFPEDTKSTREESFRFPEKLLPYLLRYLKEIRPRLLGRRLHDGALGIV